MPGEDQELAIDRHHGPNFLKAVAGQALPLACGQASQQEGSP